MARFTTERLRVPNYNESVVIWVLSQGIKERKLGSLGEYLAKSMAELTARINRYIVGEELLEAQSLSKNPKESTRRDKGKSTKQSTSRKESSRTRHDSKADRSSRYEKYTTAYLGAPNTSSDRQNSRPCVNL